MSTKLCADPGFPYASLITIWKTYGGFLDSTCGSPTIFSLTAKCIVLLMSTMTMVTMDGTNIQPWNHWWNVFFISTEALLSERIEKIPDRAQRFEHTVFGQRMWVFRPTSDDQPESERTIVHTVCIQHLLVCIAHSQHPNGSNAYCRRCCSISNDFIRNATSTGRLWRTTDTFDVGNAHVHTESAHSDSRHLEGCRRW